jgi:hypothetical protein
MPITITAMVGVIAMSRSISSSIEDVIEGATEMRAARRSG